MSDNNQPTTNEQFENVKKSAQDAFTNVSQGIDRTKGMAMLAYFLFFVPLITGDSERSAFVKYHVNQGAVLLLASLIYSFVLNAILGVIGGFATLIFFANPFMGALTGLVTAFLGLLGLVPLGFIFLGVINAANNEMKPLPLIGQFTLIK